MSENIDWQVSKTGKRYYITERDGKQVKVYESGAILDASTHHIIKAPESTLLTPKTATENINKRWEDARAALEAGAIQAVNGKSPADAQKYLGKALMLHAMAGDPGGAQYAKLLIQHTGWASAPQASGNGSLTITMDAEIARKLIDRLG